MIHYGYLTFMHPTPIPDVDTGPHCTSTHLDSTYWTSDQATWNSTDQKWEVTAPDPDIFGGGQDAVLFFSGSWAAGVRSAYIYMTVEGGSIGVPKILSLNIYNSGDSLMRTAFLLFKTGGAAIVGIIRPNYSLGDFSYIALLGPTGSLSGVKISCIELTDIQVPPDNYQIAYEYMPLDMAWIYDSDFPTFSWHAGTSEWRVTGAAAGLPIHLKTHGTYWAGLRPKYINVGFTNLGIGINTGVSLSLYSGDALLANSGAFWTTSTSGDSLELFPDFTVSGAGDITHITVTVATVVDALTINIGSIEIWNTEVWE